jgi:hypothetical protein
MWFNNTDVPLRFYVQRSRHLGYSSETFYKNEVSFEKYCRYCHISNVSVYSRSISSVSAVTLLRPKLITYLQTLIEVNPMSMSIHISIFYLRPYVISHNSQWGYIIGTLKYKFGLKLRWLVAFYDIHARKEEVAILLFCPGHRTRIIRVKF